MTEHIDRMVKRLSEDDLLKRNVPGMIGALVLMALCGLATWGILIVGRWWLLLLLPIGLLFLTAVAGMGQESHKIKRQGQNQPDADAPEPDASPT